MSQGRLRDLVGKKFGKLTIISRAENSWDGRTRWFCRCECGNEPTVLGQNLTRGATVSCGCFGREASWTGCGELSGYYWSRLKSDAKRREIAFDITIEYAWDLFLKQNRKCALTGMDIGFVPIGKIGKYYAEQTASLDRIDSNMNYETGNVQWVHKHINNMKQAYAESYFFEMCKKVVDYVSAKVIREKID